MKLTAENGQSIANHCLFRNDELTGSGAAPEGAVIVDGIISQYGFHPDRLQSHRADIVSMLGDLSDDFKSNGGGGMSFLNACMTKDGELWAEHPTIAMLFALGMGIGAVSYNLPRDIWPALPGSMPYVTINSDLLSVAT